MKKTILILILVFAAMILPRTFSSVVGYEATNIIRVEARYPDGLYYSTDEKAIAALMDALNGARYVRIPIPNMLVGPTGIQLYPDDSIEVTRFSLNTHGTVMINGKRYLVVGEINSGISEFTKELHVEENNIRTAGWWRERAR